MSQITLMRVFIVNEGAMMTQEEFNEEAQQLRLLLMKVARCYLDDDDAEDTVQDVLLRLWQMVDTLHMPIDGLATVLVRNFCIDRRRRSQRQVPVLTTDYEQAYESEGDERIERTLALLFSTLFTP